MKPKYQRQLAQDFQKLRILDKKLKLRKVMETEDYSVQKDKGYWNKLFYIEQLINDIDREIDNFIIALKEEQKIVPELEFTLTN